MKKGAHRYTNRARYGVREKDDKKKRRKSKHDSDSEDSDETYANKMKRKGKRRITYNGIEQWVTDSEEENERRSDLRSSKRHSNRHSSLDRDGNRRHRRNRKFDSDSDSDERRRLKKSGRKYEDSSEDEKGFEYKRKSRVRFRDDVESDEEWRRRRKNPGGRRSRSGDASSDSDSDAERRGGRRRRRGESSSSSGSGSDSDESLSDVRSFTRWKQDRVPYCDEYVFPCRRWLAKDEDDGKIERELRPDTVVTFYRIPADTDQDKKRREKKRWGRFSSDCLLTCNKNIFSLVLQKMYNFWLWYFRCMWSLTFCCKISSPNVHLHENVSLPEMNSTESSGRCLAFHSCLVSLWVPFQALKSYSDLDIHGHFDAQEEGGFASTFQRLLWFSCSTWDCYAMKSYCKWQNWTDSRWAKLTLIFQLDDFGPNVAKESFVTPWKVVFLLGLLLCCGISLLNRTW